MIDEADDLMRPDIHSSSLEYRERFSGGVGDWFLVTQETVSKELLEKVSPSDVRQRLSIADFGGGHGQNIAPCTELAADLTIVGSDESCFELIDQESGNGYEKHIGLLTESGLDSNSFDVVLSYRMLPHLEDWRAHVKELCRVANEAVIVEFPNRRSINMLADKLFALKKSVEGNTRKFVLFDIATVTEEFARYGFQLEEARGQYLWPMVLHRMLKNTKISGFLEKFLGVILPRNRFGSPLICKYTATEID